MMAAKMKARKLHDVTESVRRGGSYRADQGRVWEGVDHMMASLECASPTSAKSDIKEQKRKDLDDYLDHFKAVENQVGVLVMIDGKVMGSDSFGSQETLEKLFRKLVTSYTVDALETADRRQRAHSPRAARRFYEDVQKAGVQTQPSVDLGTDMRLENERVIGAALGHEGQILHLSVFVKESRHGQGGPGGSLRRASLRRNLLI
jgi:hypothetical protein